MITGMLLLPSIRVTLHIVEVVLKVLVQVFKV